MHYSCKMRFVNLELLLLLCGSLLQRDHPDSLLKCDKDIKYSFTSRPLGLPPTKTWCGDQMYTAYPKLKQGGGFLLSGVAVNLPLNQALLHCQETVLEMCAHTCTSVQIKEMLAYLLQARSGLNKTSPAIMAGENRKWIRKGMRKACA